MSQFVLAPQAARDIEEIVRYIAKDSVAAALELEDRLINTFRTLTRFPNSGHARKDLAGNRKLLFSPVGKYLILYRVRAKSVEIVAVLHAGRDIPTILSHRKAAR